MVKRKSPPGWTYEVTQNEGGVLELRIEGRMDADSAAPMLKELSAVVRRLRPATLRVDIGGVEYLNDFGATVLAELKQLVVDRRGRFELTGVGSKIEEILSFLDFESLGRRQDAAGKARLEPLTRIGEVTLRYAADLKDLVLFMGAVCLAFLHVIAHPKSVRLDDTLTAMQRTGVEALPIVGLISFLLGLIMTFMSAVQLKQFGANIYVASLVSLAMTRELGPIMTAIIVAGRSGSAFAAEIGTMQVTEEVDALRTMGFDPTVFLVVPKILAAVAVVPILTLFSDVFAILGGLVVGVFMLDLTAHAYIAQTSKTLPLATVFLGVTKSCVFAVIIAWVGCFRGFQVRGGAAAVGKATTSAVVDSIFLIIVCDSVFAVILRYWG
jgi:phospholipid/cholesterol/gamma-HCH transport system permease protein